MVPVKDKKIMRISDILIVFSRVAFANPLLLIVSSVTKKCYRIITLPLNLGIIRVGQMEVLSRNGMKQVQKIKIDT